AFNAEHGITPKSVSRKLEGDLVINDPLAELWKGDRKPDALEDPDMDEEYIPRMSDTDYGKRGRSQKPAKKSAKSEPQSESATIEDLEKQMKAAAARLDFEEAARLRDIIRDMGK
ncbi:MAG: UvrB/UvrC motif-containing protein, partial [Fibrobacter sp.]|nr:UvrB/UvrC motif-containing protein [Fibrobacter sp.]